MADKVSVVMPAYNGEAFIAEAIESVIQQTYNDWELIVVDDGSEDATSRIVAELKGADSRIRYFVQNHSGQGRARNKGISEASGSLVAFLDQDDLWEPEKLEIQVLALGQTGVDVVFSNGLIFHDGQNGRALRTFKTIVGRFPGPVMFRILLLRCPIPLSSALVRVATLRAVGPLEEAASVQGRDDYDLFLRLARCGATFLGLPGKLLRYRVHSANASRDYASILRAEIKVLQKHLTGISLDSELRVMIGDRYHHLVRILVSEGRLEEAQWYFRQLSRYDPWRVSIWIRRLLLAATPERFNQMSDYLGVAGDLLRRVLRRRHSEGSSDPSRGSR